MRGGGGVYHVNYVSSGEGRDWHVWKREAIWVIPGAAVHRHILDRMNAINGSLIKIKKKHKAQRSTVMSHYKKLISYPDCQETELQSRRNLYVWENKKLVIYRQVS